LTKVSKMLLGISDEDEEDIRKALPAYDQNAQYLYLNNDFGKLEYINTSYMLPDSDIWKAFNAFSRGKSVPSKIKDVAIEVGGGFVGMDIFMKSVEEAFDNENAYGSKIVNKTRDYATFYQGLHVLEALYPGVLKEALRIYKPTKMESELFDNPRINNILNSLLGVKKKVRKMDNTYGWVMKDQVGLIDEARNLMNNPEGKFDKNEKMAKRKMDEHFEVLLEQYESGARLFDKENMNKQLKDRRAGKMIKSLRAGKIINYNFK
jgi:hypothetical protein